MNTIFIGKNKVELYDSIDEMPIVRYIEYNKYLLIESGIGATYEDINRNIDKLAVYISMNDKENGGKQLMLMKQNLYFVLQGNNPEFLAFACIIHSINNKRVLDISAENLQSIIDKFKHDLVIKIDNI